LYGLLRRILLVLVAAATFIARERCIVGGLACWLYGKKNITIADAV
jgi:hypothetical protein